MTPSPSGPLDDDDEIARMMYGDEEGGDANNALFARKRAARGIDSDVSTDSSDDDGAGGVSKPRSKTSRGAREGEPGFNGEGVRSLIRNRFSN